MKELSRNVHRWDLGLGHHQFLLMSDIHWDNPHCDRESLKTHLDRALENDIPVFINGDFFCLMQGKFDPRRNKVDIRPEHNTATYLDDVVHTAVEWFTPYRSILKFIGYGNHETSILRNLETDPLQRFADLMKVQGGEVQVGGYGGWIILRFGDRSFKIKYYHGSGGGGPVTKGVIQNQRAMASIHGADAMWMGHVHEAYTMVHTVERLDKAFNVTHKNVLHIRTPSYKDEYSDGYMHYHVERGRPPKPIGSYLLDIQSTAHRITPTASLWAGG
jgi:UDP-2,3-diacylglucosamine pyrophosphatase LpxH